ECPPRRGGGNARSARRIGGARRAGRLLRPSGAVRSVRVRRSNASFPHWQTTFVAPEGRRDVATGGAEPKAQRNPWGRGAREWPPRRGGGNARSARRSGGARRARRLLRPSGAESMLATLSTGCARCARFTHGNQPPPLRGVPIRAHQPFTRVASSPLTGLQRPGGAEETRGVQGASEAQDAPDVSSAPPGRVSFGRRLPRVALAALASPVATNLRSESVV